MVDKYRFIRVGKSPTDQGNNPEWQIRACFDTCTDAIKIRLNMFLRSEDKEITFNFDDSLVTVRRED